MKHPVKRIANEMPPGFVLKEKLGRYKWCEKGFLGREMMLSDIDKNKVIDGAWGYYLEKHTKWGIASP